MRRCKIFNCPHVSGRRCCADCNAECSIRCQNSPERCKCIEEVQEKRTQAKGGEGNE